MVRTCVIRLWVGDTMFQGMEAIKAGLLPIKNPAMKKAFKEYTHKKKVLRSDYFDKRDAGLLRNYQKNRHEIM